MFAPHPPGLAAMWEHWADEEQREQEREERAERAYLESLEGLGEVQAAVDDYRLKEWKDG